MLCNLHFFCNLCARFFKNSLFFKNIFKNTIRESISLDLDQANTTMQRVNPYPTSIFVLNMLSAFYVFCMCSSALQIKFYHGSKHYGPRSDCSLTLIRLLLREQSGLGPYSLSKNNMQMRKQTTKVVTGGKRVYEYNALSALYGLLSLTVLQLEYVLILRDISNEL